MSDQDRDCCREFDRVSASRRGVLQGLGLAAGAATFTQALGPEAFASMTMGERAGGNTLIVLSLRGGIDGLSAVVPHGDAAYYKARPTIAVPKSRLLCANEMFGLHPSFAPLQGMFQENKVSVVHATGMQARKRSHFEAMAAMEEAGSSSTRSGWISRMVGSDALCDYGDAMSMSNSVPTSMSGSAPTLAGRNVTELSLVGTDPGRMGETFAQARRASWGMLWSQDRGQLAGSAAAVLPVTDRFQAMREAPRPPANYTASELASGLRTFASLLYAGVPLKVGAVDYGNWDLHVGLGAQGNGRMGEMVTDLATNLAAFFTDLGPMADRVTVVTMSEFGRRTVENNSYGLDHGWGNVAMVLGAGVKGGYHGRWPGLGTGTDTDSDLQVTTDYRDVIGEVVRSRFPATPMGEVLPGYTPKPVGAMA